MDILTEQLQQHQAEIDSLNEQLAQAFQQGMTLETIDLLPRIEKRLKDKQELEAAQQQLQQYQETCEQARAARLALPVLHDLIKQTKQLLRTLDLKRAESERVSRSDELSRTPVRHIFNQYPELAEQIRSHYR